MPIEAGLVQAVYTVDSSEFVSGSQKVDAALENTAARTEKTQETTAASNRKRVAAQKSADDAIFNLTASATEKELAAVDRKYAYKISNLQKYGNDEARLVKLQAAIAQEKARIVAAAEERAAAGMTATAQASDHAGHSFVTTNRAVDHLSRAFGANAGEAGTAATALSHLVSAGMNPVLIAAAALAVTIGYVIKKHEEQEEATKKATDAYREQQKGIIEWQAKIAAARAGTHDSEQRALEGEIKLHEGILERLKEEDLHAAQTHTDQAQSYTDIFRGGLSKETVERMAKIKEEGKLLDDLRLKYHGVAAAEKVNEKIADTTKADRLRDEIRLEKAKVELKDREATVQDALSRAAGQEVALKHELFSEEEKALAIDEARTAIEQRYLPLLKEAYALGNQERIKELEEDRKKETANAVAKIALADRIKGMEEERRKTEEILKLRKQINESLLSMREKHAQAEEAHLDQTYRAQMKAAEAAGTETAAIVKDYLEKKRALYLEYEQKELEDLAKHYIVEQAAAIANGQEDVRLTEAMWQARADIIQKWADKIAQIVADAKPKAAPTAKGDSTPDPAKTNPDTGRPYTETEDRAQRYHDLYAAGVKVGDIDAQLNEEGYAVEKAAGAWGHYHREVQASTAALRAMAEYRLREALANKRERETSIEWEMGFLRGTLAPLSAQQMYNAAVSDNLAVARATAAVREVGGDIHIYNSASDQVGVTAHREGNRTVIHVASDIQAGGIVDQVLRATYPNLTRGGVGV